LLETTPIARKLHGILYRHLLELLPMLVAPSYLMISYTAFMSATAIVAVHFYTLVMLLVLQLPLLL
jgi:hypothetical protein